MIKKTKFTFSSEVIRWFFSGFITCLLFLFLLRPVQYFYLSDNNTEVIHSYNIFFATTDDAYIRDTLSGKISGDPSPYNQMINVVTGQMIKLLYDQSERFPWFTIYLLSALFISFTILNKSIMKCMQRKGWNPFLIILSVVCITLAYYYWFIKYLTFTVVAAFLGTAAIIILFCSDSEKDSPVVLIIDNVLGLILFLAGYCLRKESGYCLLCFLEILFCSRIIDYLENRKKSGFKSILRVNWALLIIIPALFAVECIDRNMKNENGWTTYTNFYSSAISFFDYPHYDFDEKQEYYQSIGWTKTDYEFAQNPFYSDPIIFDGIVNMGKSKEKSYQKKGILGISALLSRINGGSAVPGSVIFRSSIRWMSALWIFTILFQLLQKKEKRSFFVEKICDYFPLILLPMYIVLCLYLSYRGRFLDRGFQTVAVPTFFYLLIGWLKTQMSSTRFKNFSSVCLTIMLLISSITFLWKKDSPELDELKVYYIEFCDEIRNYALVHPDQIIVIPNALMYSVDPFVTYQNGKPINLFEWGSLSDQTPLFLSKTQKFGFEEISPDIFLKKNVSYVSSSEELTEWVFSYLQVRIPITEETVVYTFSKGNSLIKFR